MERFYRDHTWSEVSFDETAQFRVSLLTASGRVTISGQTDVVYRRLVEKLARELKPPAS